MGKKMSARLGIDLRAARPSIELEEVTKARNYAEQGGARVQRISDGYRVTWADTSVVDYLDEEINNLVDDLYGSYSETWGADLRRSTPTEQAAALRSVREQCERVGLTFRHRAKGWSVAYLEQTKNYWPEEINVLVDDVERSTQTVTAWIPARGGRPGPTKSMSAPLDWLDAASDPRVVAIVLARSADPQWRANVGAPGWLSAELGAHGISATTSQARALLDAVAAFDTYPPDDVPQPWRDRLTAAVTAITDGLQQKDEE